MVQKEKHLGKNCEICDMAKSKSMLHDKSFTLALEIIQIYQFQVEVKKEYV